MARNKKPEPVKGSRYDAWLTIDADEDFILQTVGGRGWDLTLEWERLPLEHVRAKMLAALREARVVWSKSITVVVGDKATTYNEDKNWAWIRDEAIKAVESGRRTFRFGGNQEIAFQIRKSR